MIESLTVISVVVCFILQIGSILFALDVIINAAGILSLFQRILIVILAIIFNIFCLLALFGPYEETILDTKVCDIEIRDRHAFFFYNDDYIPLSDYYHGIVKDGDMVKVTESKRDSIYSLYYTWKIRTVQVLDKDSNLVNTHEQALQ